MLSGQTAWGHTLELGLGYLISVLLRVKNLLQGNSSGSKAVSQLGQDDSIPQCLLQLSGGRQLLPQTRLHPPEEEEKDDGRVMRLRLHLDNVGSER